MPEYDTEETIEALVRSFESAVIARDDWKHREHLVVALYYVSRNDRETALEKMRSGILNLLVNGFKIDFESENPYHETLTVFWMNAVREYYERSLPAGISEMAVRIDRDLDKDLPLLHYDRDRLFSDEARRKYLPPGD